MAITQYSLEKISIGLNAARFQKPITEFIPPGAMSNSGNPEPWVS
jgi:hypothetical protein